MIEREARIPETLDAQRCDRVAAELFSEFSRARLQNWIADGQLLFDGKQLRVKDKVFAGAVVTLRAELVDQEQWQPQDIPIQVIYEDDHLLVVDKPAGLVVHPGAGNPDGTLLNGLLYRVPEVNQVPRAGIVHRIDKDTTGLLVVAKTLASQASLVKQLQARTLSREYHAIVHGNLTRASGKVDAPIGRHPTQRTKMAVVASGKPAVTHYTALEHFDGYTRILAKLETGRTHQIRVHMTHLGYPLVGDQVYGPRQHPSKHSTLGAQAVSKFSRQALHAARLELVHPATGDNIGWESPMPKDMSHLLDLFRDE